MTDEELSKCLEIEAERDIAKIEIERLRAALAAAEQVRASEWQPIETAPKDGITIFGANAKLGQRGLVYFNASGEWEMVNGMTNFPMGIGFYPTHWMSEPMPPL